MSYSRRGTRAAIAGAAMLCMCFTAAPISAACPDFASPVNISTGTNPVSSVTGDFNRDGNPDLAIANSGSDNLSVLIGNGSGGFAAAVNYATGSTPSSIGAADFNRDGKLDLAVANLNGDNVSVLLGAGNGTFGTATNFDTDPSPVSLAIGDFDRDGKLDIAIASAGGNEIGILAGDGAGAFQFNNAFPAGNGVTAVAVGDFNNDGVDDFAVAISDPFHLSPAYVALLPGFGDGTFDSPINSGSITGDADSVSVGDFNRDGKADVAVPTGAAGNDDVAILLGNGGFGFGVIKYYTAEKSRFVAVGDVNGDGRPDLAVTNESGTISILIGFGNGTFDVPLSYQANGTPSSIAIGDWNRDGKVDLASSNLASDDVSILQNTNTCSSNCGSLGAAANFGTGTTPRSIAIGDFNHDGRLDAAVTNEGSASVSILLGAGTGSFTAAANFAAGTFPASITTGDFNRDGNTDLAVVNFTSQNFTVLLGNGSGGFTSTNYTNGLVGQLGVVAAGDINLDGKDDLVIGNAQLSAAYLLIGAGDGTFGTATVIASGFRPFGMAIADFNADGKPDVVAADNNGSSVAVMLGNGNGTFSAKVTYTVGTGPYGLVVADFNRDGIADIATANTASENISMLLGNGNGTFAPVVNYDSGKQPRQMAAGDFDADGKTDLVVANGSSSTISVLRGKGDGTLAFAVSYGPPNNTGGVAVSDFDRNGRSDVLFSNQTSSNVSLELSQCPSATDLIVTKNHVGSFFRKTESGIYRITVSNVGGPPSSGTVTVDDNPLPTGFTVISMTGDGWTCAPASVSCSRADGLAGATSYPPVILTVGVGSNAANPSMNTVTVSGGSDSNGANNNGSDSVIVTAPLPAVPTNVVATFQSNGSILITWDPAANADYYTVRRKISTTTVQAIPGNPSTTSQVDNGVGVPLQPDTTYLYDVLAVNSGGSSAPSAIDIATTTVFTDNPIGPNTTIKADHLTELRKAVIAIRRAAQQSDPTFSDVVSTTLPIKANHILDLRGYLDAARSNLGLPPMTYANTVAGTIKGADFQEIRNGVK